MANTNIQPNPNNPRTITKEEFERLKNKISRNPDGLKANKIVHENGKIIAGNQRFRALQELGLEIKDEYLLDASGWTKEQIREYLIISNVSDGEWDWDMLANEWDADELIEWGVDMPEEWGTPKETPEDIDEIPIPPKTPISKLGDLWLLGNHRVLCGDSTDKTTVERLMDGKKADMVFTDPPYGIDLVKDGKVGADFGVAKKGQYSKVINDETTETARLSFEVTKQLCNKHIIWGGNYFIDFLPFSDGWIIWDKRGDSGIKNTFADGEMAWCSFHTPIRIYTQLWNGMIREGESGKREHPTQKPLRTLSQIINDFTKSKEIILDSFLGSGSTLIACEQTDRQCYGLELDPQYVDVICKRWQTLTGQQPILEATGEPYDFCS